MSFSNTSVEERVPPAVIIRWKAFSSVFRLIVFGLVWAIITELVAHYLIEGGDATWANGQQMSILEKVKALPKVSVQRILSIGICLAVFTCIIGRTFRLAVVVGAILLIGTPAVLTVRYAIVLHNLHIMRSGRDVNVADMWWDHSYSVPIAFCFACLVGLMVDVRKKSEVR